MSTSRLFGQFAWRFLPDRGCAGLSREFAPQGWGVTEASFTAMNPCNAPLHASLGAFVLFRVSGMFGDMVAYVGWFVFLARKTGPTSAAAAEP